MFEQDRPGESSKNSEQSQQAIEVIHQKMKHLQMTAHSFFNACDKLASMAQKKSNDEEFFIQVFGNDKKLFENYLTNLTNYVKDAYKGLSSRGSNKEKAISSGNLEE